MPITRPDEYKHTNPDLAIADSDGVRGGRRAVADRAALYALSVKADQLKQDVTVVRVKADSDNGNAATDLLLIDASKIGQAAGWQVVSVSDATYDDSEIRADILELQNDLNDAENDIVDLDARTDAIEALIPASANAATNRLATLGDIPTGGGPGGNTLYGGTGQNTDGAMTQKATTDALASKVADTDPRLTNARTPTAHTHPIGDVTGLQGALDSKAAINHSHAIADVTGLQGALDSKAAAGHTHTAAQISDFATAVGALITTYDTQLKDGVPAAGNTLQKLYNLILGQFSEVTVATLAERNAYNVAKLPLNVFVLDDGDGRWALYRATSTGVNATYVKLSDPDLLNAALSAAQIKAAYESNPDTNAFTNALLAKLQGLTNYNDAALAGRVTSLETFQTNALALIPANATPQNKLATQADLAGLGSGEGGSAYTARVASFAARTQARGGLLSAPLLGALDRFVVRGLRVGWDSVLKDYGPMLGLNLIAGLQKLYYTEAAGDQYTNYGLVEADYDPAYGFTVTANSNAIGKYLGTGFVPSAYGLTQRSIAFGLHVALDTPWPNSTGCLVGTRGFSGDDPVEITNDGTIGIRGAGHSNAIGGHRTQLANYRGGGNYEIYQGGVISRQASTAPVGTLPNEITIFRSFRGDPYFVKGNISGLVLSAPLTEEQAADLEQALVELYTEVGRYGLQEGAMLVFGDSIPTGQGASSKSASFSRKVAAGKGLRELNAGAPSSRWRSSTGEAVGGYQRRGALARLRYNELLWNMGINDANADNTQDGDPATLTDLQAKLEEFIREQQVLGVKVHIVSITYNRLNSATKLRAYAAAQQAAAEATGARFYNVLEPALAHPDPDSLTVDDNHPGDEYQQLIADTILAEAPAGDAYTDDQAIAAATAAGVGDVDAWVAGPQREGQLSYSAGRVWRARQSMVNSQSAPEGNPANYDLVGSYDDTQLNATVTGHTLQLSALTNALNEGRMPRFYSVQTNNGQVRQGPTLENVANTSFFPTVVEVHANYVAANDGIGIRAGAVVKGNDYRLTLTGYKAFLGGGTVVQNWHITGGTLQPFNTGNHFIEGGSLTNTVITGEGTQSVTLTNVPLAFDLAGQVPFIDALTVYLKGTTTLPQAYWDTLVETATAGTYTAPNGVVVIDQRSSSTTAVDGGSGTGSTYVLPAATPFDLGGVKYDNNTIKKNADGQLYVNNTGGGSFVGVPDPVTGLSAVRTNYEKVALDWQPSEGATDYILYLSVQGGPFQLLAVVPFSYFNDISGASVDPNQYIRWRVAACNANGESTQVQIALG